MGDAMLSRKVLLDLLEDIFFVFDESGRLIEWNPSAENVTGYNADELASMTVTDFFEGADRRRIEAAVAEVFRTETVTVEAELVTASDQQIPYEFQARLLPDGTGFVGIGRDITKRRQAREGAEHRERVLREIYDITANFDGSFEEQIRTLLDLGRAEIGTEYGSFSRIKGEDYIFEVVSADDDSISEGDTVPISATNCEIAAHEKQTLVLGDIARDAPDETDRAGYTEWGISCYLGSPVFDTDGVYGTLCFYDTEPRRDFSDWEVMLVDLMAQWTSHELRHRRAHKQLQEQNTKLEQFASVVSHDLRNPLNILSLELEDDGTERSKRCIRAVGRMQTLIDDVLMLARAGQGIDATEPVELEALVERAWNGATTDQARLELDADRRMQADESRLEQLFENLFRNTLEHGSTSPQSQPPDDADEHAGTAVTVSVGLLSDGFYVEDDGPGIPPEHRADVFEEGYSTKSDGTGFGLSIVREIATAHGWETELTDGAAGGARFEFTGVSWIGD